MRNLGVSAILLLLALLAGVAWLSNFPDSAAVRWAAERPLVGPWIAKAREAYLRSEAAEAAGGGEVGIEYVVIGPGGRRGDGVPGVEEPIGARPFVWLRPGMELRRAPDERSLLVGSVQAYSNVPMFDRRGEWYEVEYRNDRGWVRSPEVFDGPPLGSDPAPVLPVPARAPDPEQLRLALAPLEDRRSVGRLGEYPLYGDPVEPELLGWLDRVAADVEGAYGARYGVVPIDRAREVIVLFSRRADFELLRAGLPLHEGRINGLASDGLVALSGEGIGRNELAATLIHELAHLLNRRALGPALPPWLDEGIARDLGSSEVDEAGRLLAAGIGGSALQEGRQIEWRGAQAALVRLRRLNQRRTLPGLERLVELDREGFYAGLRQELHYDQSGFFIRYLLDSGDPRLAAGLRDFLSSISTGGPPSPEELALRLEIPWTDLNAGFSGWLATQKPRWPGPPSGV